MHNDLTTVEPPISVTAVSMADYNCFQSPCFWSTRRVSFHYAKSFGNFGWEINGMLPSVWKFSGQSTGSPNSVGVRWTSNYKRMYENTQSTLLGCLWSKWSTSTGGPLWLVGLIRSKLAVPCQKILVSISTFPSSNQTFSQNWMDHFNLFGNFGCFSFSQKVWFAFSATSSREWHSIFQTLRGITRFLETFPRSFLSIQLCSQNF